jgi:MobA/MobL family
VHERANARLYTELEMALPRELSSGDREALAREFIATQVGPIHPCTWALHVSHALDGDAQPHLHVMLSERTLDGIARDPAHFFKRANTQDPARGGAAKDPAWNHREKVVELRAAWAETANRALARAGLEVRIDHRSLAAQGIDREPEPKLGPEQTAMLRDGVVTPQSARVLELRQYRTRLAQVERQVERTQAQVIDLAQVRAVREAREREAQAQAQRQAQERERVAQVLRRVETPEARVQRLLAESQAQEERAHLLLLRVQAREAAQLDQGRQTLEQTTGQTHHFAQGERVTGRLVDQVEVAGQDFGRIVERTGTVALVPWRPAMAPHLGQQVAVDVDAQRAVSRLLSQVEPVRERAQRAPPTRERERGRDRGMEY